jgi:hypothetical protein
MKEKARPSPSLSSLLSHHVISPSHVYSYIDVMQPKRPLQEQSHAVWTVSIQNCEPIKPFILCKVPAFQYFIIVTENKLYRSELNQRIELSSASEL